MGHVKNILLGGAAMTAGYFISRSFLRSSRKIDLKDKVILITGGARGLGLTLARQLADMHAKIVICAREEDDLRKAGDDLSYYTSNFLAIPCDVTDQEQVRSMMKEVREKMGTVDILINNAGIIQVGPMEQMKKEDYEQAMNVHYWGPFHTTSEALKYMFEKGEGRIVNIVSIGGKLSFPHLLPYNASKYALSGFSEGLAAELGQYNIRVTTVYPGLMRTGSPRNIDVKGSHEDEYAWFKTSDSLPLLTISADKAARKIIRAMRLGKNTLTLTMPAKLGKIVSEAAPDLTISFFDLVNRLLPEPRPGGENTKKGHESESKKSETVLTKSTDKAAGKNLET